MPSSGNWAATEYHSLFDLSLLQSLHQLSQRKLSTPLEQSRRCGRDQDRNRLGKQVKESIRCRSHIASSLRRRTQHQAVPCHDHAPARFRPGRPPQLESAITGLQPTWCQGSSGFWLRIPAFDCRICDRRHLQSETGRTTSWLPVAEIKATLERRPIAEGYRARCRSNTASPSSKWLRPLHRRQDIITRSSGV